jgi:hypothetical protein
MKSQMRIKMLFGLSIIKKIPILFLILSFAFIARFFGGVEWGLPFKYDPDEGAFIQPAIDMYFGKNLNPKWFGHPGSTLIYINMIAYIILSKMMIIFGDFNAAGQVLNYFKNDPTILFFLLRLIQVFLGCIVIWLVYRIGQRIFDKRVGLLAAAMVASMPLMIHYSQIVRTDMLAVLFMLLVVEFSIKSVGAMDGKQYILPSFFIAGAIATKYPAGIIALYLAWIHIAQHGFYKKIHKLLVAAFLSFTFIFIFSPYIFIDYQSVIRDVYLEGTGSYVGAMSEGVFQNLLWYFSLMAGDSLSYIGVIFLLVGIHGSFRSKNIYSSGLFFVIILFIISISLLSVRWERWLVLILPFVSIVTAYGFYEFLDRLAVAKINRFLLVSLTALFLLCIAYPSFLQIYHRTKTDTRTEAYNWVLENIPKNKHIIVEAYGPQLPAGQYKMSFIIEGVPNERAQGSGFVMPARSISWLSDVKVLNQAKVDYVIVSNFYDRYKLYPSGNEGAISNYENFFNKAKLVKQFLPSGGVDVHPFKANLAGGPAIRVYEVIPE